MTIPTGPQAEGPESPWRCDTGLARERSDLSWGRTLLSVLIVTALFLRWLPQFGAGVLLPIVAGAMAGSGLVLLRHRRRREVADGVGSAAGEVTGLTLLVIVTGLAATALILSAHPF